MSGGGDNIKKWACPDGDFMKNFSGHNTIIHSMALNHDNVLMSGGDNGSLYFWDYKTGLCGRVDLDLGVPCSFQYYGRVILLAFCCVFLQDTTSSVCKHVCSQALWIVRQPFSLPPSIVPAVA